MLIHLEIPQPPGPSSPAFGYPPTANRWPSISQVSTDCARGGRRANSTPGPAWGKVALNFCLEVIQLLQTDMLKQQYITVNATISG